MSAITHMGDRLIQLGQKGADGVHMAPQHGMVMQALGWYSGGLMNVLVLNGSKCLPIWPITASPVYGLVPWKRQDNSLKVVLDQETFQYCWETTRVANQHHMLQCGLVKIGVVTSSKTTLLFITVEGKAVTRHQFGESNVSKKESQIVRKKLNEILVC